MHLPLLRAAVGVVEVLVDEPVGLLGDDSGTPGPLERGDGGKSIVDSSSSPETRHRALCIALAAAREEAKAIGRSNDDDSRQSDDVPTPDGSTPLIPSAIADAIVQGFRGSRTPPDFPRVSVTDSSSGASARGRRAGPSRACTASCPITWYPRRTTRATTVAGGDGRRRGS